MKFTQDHSSAQSKTTIWNEPSCYDHNLVLRATVTTHDFMALILVYFPMDITYDSLPLQN